MSGAKRDAKVFMKLSEAKLIQRILDAGDYGQTSIDTNTQEVEACMMVLMGLYTVNVMTAIGDLRKTIDEHEKTATKLGRALNWLTAVIAGATIIGLITTVWLALRGG